MENYRVAAVISLAVAAETGPKGVVGEGSHENGPGFVVDGRK
jgi:hypothetical protein